MKNKSTLLALTMAAALSGNTEELTPTQLDYGKEAPKRIQLTAKQKKARRKSKAARKARRKNRH